MKIAIFTDVYAPEINGVSTSIQNSTQILAEKGHEILIFCPKYKGYKEKHIKNITVKRYPAFSFATNKATRLAYTPLVSIITELKKFEPDLIHIHTPMNMGVAGIMASKMTKIKNIQTYHTYIPDFMVYLSPKNLFGISKVQEYFKEAPIFEDLAKYDFLTPTRKTLKGIGGDFKRLAKSLSFVERKEERKEKIDLSEKFAWNFTRLLYNRADLVLTPSNSLKKELMKNGILAPVVVQTNGIETEEFSIKTDYKLSKRILHIGRLGPEKNIDVILKAFEILYRKDNSLKLDISGDGPERKYLEKLTVKLKIDKAVSFGGFVDRKKLLSSIKKYDLFVTASTIETQGLVILESMASGLPIVGVDALAIPEAVKNGENGYIVKPGDFKGMAKAMDKILSDKEIREDMGKKSVGIAKEHELTAAIDHLEKVYSELAGEKVQVSK